MNIVLVLVGKTNKKYLIEGISDYQKRLKHYVNFEIVEILNVKKVKNFSEKEVIATMRRKLKKKSYILWRKRVRRRITKHRKLLKLNN